MRTETHILAVAMHALAGEIVSEDGVASAAIREAGDRLLEQSEEIKAARELAKAFHDDQAILILEMKGWREQAAELAVALLSPNSDYSRAVLQKYQERIEK